MKFMNQDEETQWKEKMLRDEEERKKAAKPLLRKYRDFIGKYFKYESFKPWSEEYNDIYVEIVDIIHEDYCYDYQAGHSFLLNTFEGDADMWEIKKFKKGLKTGTIIPVTDEEWKVWNIQ
jgi:hypothetical protein